MGQMIAIIFGLLALLGLASFWVLKLTKGAKLEVITEVQEDIVQTQHEQLKAANERHDTLDALVQSKEPI